MADISKIKIPDGTSLNIKDATARQAIANLPKPMVFKGSLGTGGTITSLPTASSSNTGYVYKVIKAGTYASQSAKIGDTFVSDGSSWVLIPSGDEPSGTVTSIKISATSPININNSAAITTSGTRTISHASSGVSSGTYKSVTVNSTGHVTAGTNPTTIDGYGIIDSAGRIVTGKEYTVDGETVVAGTGAEVFNNYDGTFKNIATGDSSHAEGSGTKALSYCTHTEGSTTIATGDYSHAEGILSQAKGSCSHVEGFETIASGYYQHVQGYFNVEDLNNTYAFIIGNGNSDSARSNAFAIDWNGKIYVNNATVGVDINALASTANAAAPQSTTYTKTEVDTALAAKLNTADVDNALSSTSTKPVQNKVIQAPVAKLVNDGAKNLLKNTATSRTLSGVTFTVNNDDSVTVTGTATGSTGFRIAGVQGSNAYADAIPIPRGRYTIYPSNSGSSTIRWGIGIMTASNATRNVTYIFDNPVTLDVTNNTTRYDFTLAVSNGTVCNGETLYPMICTAEDYAISSEYVPYAPNNRELYDMSLPLQDFIFGVGTTLEQNDDLNNYNQAGKLNAPTGAIAQTIVNTPWTASGFMVITIPFIIAASFMQFVIPNTVTGKWYRRRYTQGTWSNWIEYDGTAVT